MYHDTSAQDLCMLSVVIALEAYKDKKFVCARRFERIWVKRTVHLKYKVTIETDLRGEITKIIKVKRLMNGDIVDIEERKEEMRIHSFQEKTTVNIFKD